MNRAVPRAATPPTMVQRAPQPASWGATGALLFGLLATAVTFYGATPSDKARYVGVGAGLSLVVFALMEVRRSWGNLLRADLVCMTALYYLVFVEFFVPQPDFDTEALTVDLDLALQVVLASFGAIALGRHLVGRRSRPWAVANKPFHPSALIALFWLCVAAGYFHMLLATGFDPLLMIWHFMGPRFGAPWARGQFGDAGVILYEVGATKYLVPPIAGIILGRRHLYSWGNIVTVSLALTLTLFYGFTTGTRSIIGAYLITFLVAYNYAAACSRRRILQLGAVAGLILVASTVYGLEFRSMGLRAYWERGAPPEGSEPLVFFVDYNLLSIAELVTVFPDQYPYLGWEVPEWMLVRLVPRALWSDKPDGTNISPGKYLNAPPQTTISATFIGEAYMCYGAFGSVVAGLFLGWLSAYWTRKAFSLRSDFGILLYGSGFFAAVITMRSLYMLPVAALPVLAVLAFRFSAGGGRSVRLTPSRVLQQR